MREVDQDQHGQQGYRTEGKEDVPDVDHVGPFAFAQNRHPVNLHGEVGRSRR